VVADSRDVELRRVPWRVFYHEWEWPRGEHVTIIGPTGAGKTHLMRAILPKHTDVVFVSTKPRDMQARQLIRDGYVEIDHWPPPVVTESRSNRFVLRTAPRSIEHMREAQRAKVHYMFKRVYEGPPGASEDERGLWTIAIPDLVYVQEELGLERDLSLLWWHGRELRISLVVDVQQPVHILRAGLDQPVHFFLFRPRDRDRLRRTAEIGMGDTELVRYVLEHLDSDAHEFLYIDSTDPGTLLVTAVA
jgi:energy-coupling factor transporter ATP-binding protein EcfA2